MQGLVSRKPCRVSYLSMTRIPAFNILVLGLKSAMHTLIQGFKDLLFETLYTVSMSPQIFLFLSAVCLVYFIGFLPSPLTLSSFSGSAVIVYGTVITNNSWPQNPTWECFVDNISIGSSPRPPASENNQILCGGGPPQFEDGPHLLTVNASVLNQQTFWFDQIQYAPSASVSLNQSLLRIDSHDSAIQYSPGWQSMDALVPGSYYYVTQVGNSSYTETTGANLTYQFSGSY
jgi:hypothetical protein